MSKFIRVLLVFVLVVSAISPAVAQIAVKNQGYIPYSDAPIFYRSDDISDPVAKLQKELAAGRTQLMYDANDHGYLKSVLELLDIPISSQTLVFSKTSFQYPKISPEHPRALYYNDDVYVGSVHDGKEIEIVSFDARQGAIFYLLHEQKADNPAFERAELDCTQCHIAAGTRGVPGVLLRSVQPTVTGTLVTGAPSFITDQESPLNERWGGWYVTGKLAPGTMANAVDGKFDSSAYLAPGSDEVALLVLAHQTQMHNLITLTNYKTRITSKFERPAEQLLRYLLFVNETPLPHLDRKQTIAASAFAREFAARGPRDSKGRSLRDFDLSTRIFRYPCSYLIYSDAFDALPEPAKTYVYHRLLTILSADEPEPDFESLAAGDRKAILEILLETKRGLPQEWLDYAQHRGTHK